MGQYNNKKFGQTMKKSNKSSGASRYQRQFGQGNQQQQLQSENISKAEEAAARRRVRQEQSERIDSKFGYHRLEDQFQERQNDLALRAEGGDGAAVNKLTQRRGWLFNMAATTVRIGPN